MKEMKKISIITVAVIVLLLGVFVGIKTDVWNLFNNNKEPDTTENEDIEEDEEDKDKEDENTGVIEVIGNSTPVITINGEEEIIIEIGTLYTDLGAKAYDSVYGDLTSAIVVENNVDTTKLGTYTVTYKVTNKSGKSVTVTRTVKVVDTTIPEIVLDDSEDLLVEADKKGVFIDPTVVTVNDNSKETITPVITYSYYTDSIENAVTVEKVDLAKLGNYIIHYNATDSSGNKAVEVTRKVIVNDTTGPVITFSREGTDEVERNAYLTVNIADFSATTTKYIFVEDGMYATSLEDTIDESEMLDLPENGIINPSSNGVYRLYVKSVDALGNENAKWSEGTFAKDSELTDDHEIVANSMELGKDEKEEGTYSYIEYNFTLNNFEDNDVVKIIAKLYSTDLLLATNTVINDGSLNITDLYEYINRFIISTTNKDLGDYLGTTVINTSTGYTAGVRPDRVVLEVVTLNNGIYTSTVTNNSITPTEWSEAIYLSVENMIVDEIEVGEDALKLNVGVNVLVESNTVSNITVELYHDDELIATNTATEEYINELNAVESGHLVNFDTTFYLKNNNVDPKFDTTLGTDGYQVDKIPNNVKITVTTDSAELTNYVNINFSYEQINNWNNALK